MQTESVNLKELKEILFAIAEGYPTWGADDRLIIVQNPKATPEAIGMRGVDNNLVLDVKKLYGDA